MEQFLTEAAANIAIRLEVESTLTSVLHDVETAHTLEQALHAHNVLQDLRQKYAALLLRYQEREAVWEVEQREREKLGIQFLEDIVKLSERQVREENERISMEMQLQRAMLVDTVGMQKDVTTGVQDIGVADLQLSLEERESDTIVPGEELIATDESRISNYTALEGGSGEDQPTLDDNELRSVLSNKNQLFIQNNTLHPHDMDQKSLMNVFVFLEPIDVMNLAQSNKLMYSKIDLLFGIGSDHGSSNAALVSSSDDTPASAPDSTGDDKQSIAVNYSVPSTTSSLPSTTVASAVSSSTSSLPNSLVSSPIITLPSTSTISTPTSSLKRFDIRPPLIPSLSANVPGATWLSRFGGLAQSTTAPPTTTATINAPIIHLPAPPTPPVSSTISTPSSIPTAVIDSEIKLNAAMANSMASKLTPAELSIILRMREKLQKCEADADRWRLEKEDVVANLASVEMVKEFLLTRVRDTEKIVQKQQEEMKEVQKKNLADQEVIVFLDEKVKSLEKIVQELKSKEASTKQASSDLAEKSEKKVILLSDMLRFEREQMLSKEKEWRVAKKVLVKEIKGSRAHIVAMEAELEGLRTQNFQLREGLMSLSPSSDKKGIKFQ